MQTLLRALIGSVAASLLVTTVVAAQEPDAALAPPPPTLTVEAPGGARLAEGSWVYAPSVTRGGTKLELGRRTLTVRAADHAGSAAWLLVDETASRGQVLRDSLFVSRAELRPLRLRTELGPLRVAMTFPGDSITGELSLPGAEPAAVALLARDGLVANIAMLESVLSLAPLDSGWSASVHQLSVSPVGTSLVPLTLRVMGTEQVTVPAGTFSTWLLELSATEVAQRLWVDRATGRVVRTQNPAPGQPDVMYESVLVSSGEAEGARR